MSPMPRAGRLRLRLLLCIATVAAVASGVDGHTRGVRPGRATGRPFTENATQAEELERLFMRWVRCVGGLKRTFHHAPLKRAFPSYSLVVDEDPAAGGLTSVQAAVDSLPTINLVRFVIKVNAGKIHASSEDACLHPAIHDQRFTGRRKEAFPGIVGVREKAHQDQKPTPDWLEKVKISSMREFVTLEGAGADKTIVQWGDTADMPAGPRGRPLGTYGARNVTFTNKAPVPNAGATGKRVLMPCQLMPWAS